MVYNENKKTTFFGILKKDPAEIAEPLKIKLETFYNVIKEKYVNSEDNIIKDNRVKSMIEKGLEELREEGWKVRKSLEEYYV